MLRLARKGGNFSSSFTISLLSLASSSFMDEAYECVVGVNRIGCTNVPDGRYDPEVLEACDPTLVVRRCGVPRLPIVANDTSDAERLLPKSCIPSPANAPPFSDVDLERSSRSWFCSSFAEDSLRRYGLIFGVEEDGEEDIGVSYFVYGALTALDSGDGNAGRELPEELRLCNFVPLESLLVDENGTLLVDV